MTDKLKDPSVIISATNFIALIGGFYYFNQENKELKKRLDELEKTITNMSRKSVAQERKSLSVESSIKEIRTDIQNLRQDMTDIENSKEYIEDRSVPVRSFKPRAKNQPKRIEQSSKNPKKIVAHKKGSGQDNDTESSNKHQGVDDDDCEDDIDNILSESDSEK